MPGISHGAQVVACAVALAAGLAAVVPELLLLLVCMPCSFTEFPSQNPRVHTQTRIGAESERLRVAVRLRARQHGVVIQSGQLAQNHGVGLAHIRVDAQGGLNAHSQARKYRAKESLRVRGLFTIQNLLHLRRGIGDGVRVRRK